MRMVDEQYVISFFLFEPGLSLAQETIGWPTSHGYFFAQSFPVAAWRYLTRYSFLI